jgi:L-lactate utilization protein LutB
MTAVEWIVKQLTPAISLQQKHIDELLKKALQMEENQILDFTRNAVRKILDEDRANPFNLEEYYQETYGSTRES